MKAQDIMTRDVTTVSARTPVLEIAKLMSERHISGVPVLAEDRHVLGVVSQSDLLHRPELGTERKRKSWLRMLTDPDSLAREYAKSHGLTAHDVMTRPVVSVTDDADLQQVADILDRHHIKRVPVVNNGKLVGIISRGDIVRALSMHQVQKTTTQLDDASLQEALLTKMRQQSWLDTSYVTLTVNDGRVQVWGLIRTSSQKEALRVLIEETAGVTNMDDNLRVGMLHYAAI